SAAERTRRDAVGGVAPGSELLERRPREQQPLLADVAEADQGLGLVAAAAQLEDHALAEGRVPHVVTDLEPQALGPAALRPPGLERPLDDAVAAGRHPQRPVAGAGGRPPPAAVPAAPAAGPAVPLDVAHELGRDLVEEPAGRVVLRAAEQRAAPGVGEVEAAPGPGDAHVGEPALLLELVGLGERAQVGEDAVLHP